MQKVYFISGLGADSRAFSLLDLSFCHPVFIDWIRPTANESLESYAQRMMEQIQETDATIVGLSFGGMLASTMALLNPNLKVIVIASNKSAQEFPSYLRVGKYFPVYNWMPNGFYKQKGQLKHWIFGAQSPEAKSVFSAIQQDSDPAFIRWAIYAILHWNKKQFAPNIVHIHGANDHLLPCKYVKADYIIENGTHILPLDFPVEISAILKKVVLKSDQ